MKKAIVFVLCIMSMTMLTACSFTSFRSAVKDIVNLNFASGDDSTGDAKEWDDTDSPQDQQDEMVIDADDLQKLYGKAVEYEYMALGYYQDPDNPSGVRDGYVPYDENYVQESVEYLKSEAHGVSVRLYMVDASTATEANEKCAERDG